MNHTILALALKNTVMLGLELTKAFSPAPGGYVPYTVCNVYLYTPPGGCVDLGDIFTDAGGHDVHVAGFIANDALPTGTTPGSGGGYFIIKNS